MRLLLPLPITKGHWQRIGIDFISDLPTSENGHNCIVTFVNHMTKKAHWRAGKITIDAPAFAQIFIPNIVRLDGGPREVVSDPNVLFTTDYLWEVARILQILLLMSTVFHPEMDSLSENSNKMVIRYLHRFTTHDQANWDEDLPLTEYAWKFSVHSLTKLTPFVLDLGYEPPLPPDSNADLQGLQANDWGKTL